MANGDTAPRSNAITAVLVSTCASLFFWIILVFAALVDGTGWSPALTIWTKTLLIPPALGLIVFLLAKICIGGYCDSEHFTPDSSAAKQINQRFDPWITWAFLGVFLVSLSIALVGVITGQ